MSAVAATWPHEDDPPPPHGTELRYRLHLRQRRADPSHQVDEACRKAHAAESRRYRARRRRLSQARFEYALGTRMNALEELAVRHPEEFDRLWRAGQERWARSARGRALSRDDLADVVAGRVLPPVESGGRPPRPPDWSKDPLATPPGES